MESIEERIKNFEEFHDVAPVEEAKNRQTDVWTAAFLSARRV